MKRVWIVQLAMMAFVFPLGAMAQSNAAASGCPVVLRWPGRWGRGGLEVDNTSGKKIVGLTFYVAVADATEHWKWMHWDWDDSRPLRELGWTKEIKAGAKKTLSWDLAIGSEHSSGGAFVLANVLYADGSGWEDAPDRATCTLLWYGEHKKSFARPVELPVR